MKSSSLHILVDVDVQYVWRFLRAQKIDLAGRKSWCQSNDPDFAAKAAEIVGLERVQGYLKLANGRALTGQSHNYKRHGTTTLFAMALGSVGVGRSNPRTVTRGTSAALAKALGIKLITYV
jgi:hypothetical protein